MKTAAVTGAGGFVGRHLCAALQAAGWQVRAATRSEPPAGCTSLALGPDLNTGMAADRLAGVDAVFHLAGIAHEGVAAADRDRLHRINVLWTRDLLHACDAAAVPRLIWLSSIKVLGDISETPLEVDAPYAAGNAYAQSKVAAERALLEAAVQRTHPLIVRPPLVYGPEVRGNFASMLGWLARGVPLPLAAATARRSLVGVDNLTHLLVTLAGVTLPATGAALPRIFHVADDRDLAVAELLRILGDRLGHPARLWRMPPSWLRALAALTSRQGAYQRLFQPLRVSQQATRTALGWAPPFSCEAQLEKTATWYLQRR